MSNEIFEYKCPCCDGKIEFNSREQKMKCPFCDTEFDVETLQDFDEVLNSDVEDKLDIDPGQEQWEEEEGAALFVCRSCGGEIVCEETTAATSCPYCGNPVVLVSRLKGELKPDTVIPFKLDKEQAKAALLKHYKGKKLLPDVFRDRNRLNEIRGMYVPFWLFTADADASVRYKGTKVRHWSDSRYDYTETSFYAVQRIGSISFDDVPADGASRIDDATMESLEPYDMKDAVDFQTAYLSGYLADRYDVTSEDCKDRVASRMKTSAESAMRETVQGYVSLTTESSSVHCNSTKVRYALLPVWFLNTEWDGKKYSFAMNGQTGKMVGDLPMDKGKYWRYLLLYTGIFTAASFLVGYLLHIL